MKTNLLHLTFDMHIGGTEQVIRNLVEATDKSRFNTFILCIESPVGPIGEMLSEKGYRVDALSRSAGFDLKLVFEIRRYAIQHQIDVLHCHQYTPWVYGTLASVLTGTKVIFTEHGRFYPDRSSWKRKYINPLLVKLTDHITSISKATKQALVDYEYIPASRIDVIYNGIAELEGNAEDAQQLRDKLSISEDTLILGTISRLDPIKNHRLLIASFARVQEENPKLRLLIVGDGNLRPNLEQQVEELEISDTVIFTGFQTNPVDYLELMDIFLLPSLSEGTSMTLLEAMSLAKPCIVTDVGGNPEIIEDQISGLVTPSNDENRLVAACDSLINDAKLRKKLGDAGKARFEQSFTVQCMLRSYEAIYL